MRRFLTFVLCTLCLCTFTAQANDFLELKRHYEVSTLSGSIHIKVPVFSRGGYNYYVRDTLVKHALSADEEYHSLVYFVKKNTTQKIELFYFNGESLSSGPSGNDEVGYGYAWMRSSGDIGSLVISNEYTGAKHTNPNDGSKHRYTVIKKQEVENDMDNVTWLEIDWYPSEALKNDTFDIGIDVYVEAVRKHWPSEVHGIIKTNLTGINNMVDPQLMEPYFYAMSGEKKAGYGCAAVPYSLFYEPIEYTTSFNNSPVKTSERADNIYVRTTDSVQPNFNASFTVYYDKDAKVTRPQTTSSVAIPAYHRLHDLTAYEQQDSTGTYTGTNVLRWNIYNPNAVDLVEGDYFEVQRASKEDFSDAETVSVQPMQRGENKGTYTFEDDSRSTWTGNSTYETDTIREHISTTLEQYVLQDANGTPMCELNLKMTADKLMMPSKPVYYRVRRASAAVWGWKHEFAKDTSMIKHNFLAPLATSQPTYELDEHFAQNHQVHFRILIDNKEVTFAPHINDCSLSHTVNQGFSDEVNVKLAKTGSLVYAGTINCTIRDKEGNITRDRFEITSTESTISVPREGEMYFETEINSNRNNFSYTIDDHASITFYTTGIGSRNLKIEAEKKVVGGMNEAEVARYAEMETTIKQMMFEKLRSELASDYGRCMWDRTAKLVLVRSSKEDPALKKEIIIPQDSIRRQADGSWIAYYTDVANNACTHYTYAVRIDQSASDLHVQDSIDLQPRVINGKSLYYDEAAAITSFTATQGAIATELKRGVLLNWQASSEAVDEYVLLRKPVGSTASADTVYTGLDVTYLDLTAVPDVHYDYTIVTNYECNGKHSENNASTEGWRTPYGEIRGAILMPDNSGIAGVQVALQKEGTVVKTLTTDATGAFRFDSLLYDIDGSTDYVIIPTAAYGTFRYNNTSAGSAAITLSADNAVAMGINFENADGVRLSGRALYDISTIPVAGAMFVLNGDTVRRNGAPLTTGVDGNFELTLTKSQPYTMRIVKPGHTFVNEGYLEVTTGERTFALSKALDGVRFYDQTKVRLVGRVAGGIDQRDLPEAFGLGTNNLGDNLTLVLQLEGDNTAHFVHDPQDLTRDTMMQSVQHSVFSRQSSDVRVVGTTNTLIEKKRITIHPDANTGEFAVDLYPVKYKVIQATANGYATLFASGQSNETFDLTNAPLVTFDPVQGSDSVHYNAVYDRIYRSPVQLSLSQYIYGLKREGLGEPEMAVDGLMGSTEKVNLYTPTNDGTIQYLLGYPLYYHGRQYQFEAFAHEDYYYNNIASGKLDRVPQRGGEVVIHNGLHNTKNSKTLSLDAKGKNLFFLDVDNLNTETSGTGALCTVSAVLQMEGASIETTGFQAFVVGSRINEKELTATDADIKILDIVRDPGGAGSSAWVESGTTYSFSYSENYDAKIGLELKPEYGGKAERDIGAYAGVGGGSYTGSHFTTGKLISTTIPLVASYSWGWKYSYSFTTTDKISTSSKKNKSGIGANADVFVGAMMSVLSGKAKSVAVIDDSLFNARQPAIKAGTMHVWAQGNANGHKYYLVTGEKVVMGSTISNTFAWSQHYILETIIPRLIMERYNLLERFPDQATAQAAADARDEAVYWYINPTTAISMKDTLAKNSYKMILPQQTTKAFPNRVGALENVIKAWIGVLYDNEKEKVMARQYGLGVGTYSVNYGNTYSHSNSYSSTFGYSGMPIGSAIFANSQKSLTKSFTNTMESALKSMNKEFGEELDISKIIEDNFFNVEEQDDNAAAQKAFETVTPETKWKLNIVPVLEFNPKNTDSKDSNRKKSTGFTLVPDDQGDITVTVFRAPVDSVWEGATELVRDKVDIENREDLLYGSYVFYTQAGTTYCTHEGEEKTMFYQEGTLLSNPTLMIAKPELSIDTYEQANIPADQRATFRIELRNGGQQQYGMAGSGTVFTLSFIGASNPNGAKVFLGGAALNQTVNYFMTPGQSISQIIEVERGLVDDYENLQLMLSVADCAKTNTMLNFSVHFLPESSPVALAAPRQGWVMNTLSPKDSVGYYLPIDINGFNIRHKNFDHIEFQYKLASQSDDDWTNMCSFYADDSLYNLASGNKAMIENGRIAPFRFYGERDPMEQQYDLRAVSFCRHGSGFVTKSSPIISGTKDTRPPRVFGQPEPANAILGVGDNLKLRFNEAIAGNYLDEDNNFQLVGRTNATGITNGTSVHFDGSLDSYAATKVSRTLSGRSISLDMLVKPADPNASAVFFRHGEDFSSFVSFGKTSDNKLYVATPKMLAYSKTIDPMLDFTRVIVTYNAETNALHFYCGTKDVTDESSIYPQENLGETYKTNAPLVFGPSFNGNMLEARVWTKVLTQEEIAATHLKRLTGYERELAAYYPMNEGKGMTIVDKANGATLYMHGATWTNRQSFSLHLNKDQRVQLNGNVLSRSKVYDMTLMFWFKSQSEGTLFSSDKFEITNHKLQITDNEWHHYVLSINRTYNNASVFVDGKLISQQPADSVPGITGAMYLGGGGFEGNIDEFVVFEQALPKSFIEQYDNAALYGDEMGLMALLSFEELKLNASGVLEPVFSINDQRLFRDANGNVVNKVVPLIISDVTGMSDKANYAPISDHGKLTKLNFDWAFNNDELLINLNMADREINKQSLYITVRDVEDLHGNPMVSPATWTAFVDKNALKWEYHQITMNVNDNKDASSIYDIQIINNSGKRHQYTIESLPSWLTVNRPSGAMDPMEEKTLRFTFSSNMPVGVYSDIIYLSDEDGLLDPLRIEYTVAAVCPYDEPDRGKYNMNMSICGQVLVNGTYDADPNDRVIALYRNSCVGMTSIDFDETRNTSKVHLSVYGNEAMNGKPLSFLIWQASTGKVLPLTVTPDSVAKFTHGAVYGCGNEQNVRFNTSGTETQNIALEPGWNWVSYNVELNAANSLIKNVMTSSDPWSEGDIIKTPSTQDFITYSSRKNEFVGTFNTFDYHNIYMFYTKEGNTLRISGDKIPAENRFITIAGDKQWTELPCLFDQTTPITEALADYYEQATPGDIVKSHGHFAYFSTDGKWEGDLKALRPGEGYLFRRLGQGKVTVHFYEQKANAPKQAPAFQGSGATTMTMIARVEDQRLTTNDQQLMAYIGDELVGVATQIDSLYFLTISSDAQGELRFESEDGTVLVPVTGNPSPITYVANAHHGSLRAPVVLMTSDELLTTKIIENNHVIIIRNNEKYDVTGKKL